MSFCDNIAYSPTRLRRDAWIVLIFYRFMMHRYIPSHDRDRSLWEGSTFLFITLGEVRPHMSVLNTPAVSAPLKFCRLQLHLSVRHCHCLQTTHHHRLHHQLLVLWFPNWIAKTVYSMNSLFLYVLWYFRAYVCFEPQEVFVFQLEVFFFRSSNICPWMSLRLRRKNDPETYFLKRACVVFDDTNVDIDEIL